MVRLIPIDWFRFSRSDITEFAGTCANISKDHESSSTPAPAFNHVWAIAALADSMQSMPANNISYILIFAAGREANFKPIRLSFE
jgi:hypothetical protein